MYFRKIRTISISFKYFLATVLISQFLPSSSISQEIPYPKSNIIQALKIDWNTHKRSALGSDNFSLTWADDDAQYGAWGDGGGFGASPELNRVSLGIARIEGTAADYVGYNRYGHAKASEFPATLTGKSWGMLCLEGNLYMWVHPDNIQGFGAWKDHLKESRMYYSDNKGASWKTVGWKFTRKEELVGGCILQYGKNYSGAPDKYTYHYFCKPNALLDSTGEETELQMPGEIFLARVSKNKILDKTAYEFFIKMKNGKPQWTKNINKKQPVFLDPNGVGLPIGISFNPTIKRFLLTTEHSKGQSGSFGLFEGASPWGPWYTVEYMSRSNFTEFGHEHSTEIPANTFFWAFPTKWMSEGEKLVMTFTGAGQGKNNDSFNTVIAQLIFK